MNAIQKENNRKISNTLHTTAAKLQNMIDNLQAEKFAVTVLDDGNPRDVSTDTSVTFKIMKADIEKAISLLQ